MLSRYGTDENGELIKKAIVYTKSEHFISKDKIDPDALQIIHRLHDLGFIAYIVGGAVRDLIIGNTPKDFDIVTNATPSKIKKYLEILELSDVDSVLFMLCLEQRFLK